MKATFDFPDDLYRRLKARSAMEGRPLRSVAMELFQKWIQSGSKPDAVYEKPTAEEIERYPWLAISAKHVKPGASHDMDDIRESISRGWAAEFAAKSGQSSPSR